MIPAKSRRWEEINKADEFEHGTSLPCHQGVECKMFEELSGDDLALMDLLWKAGKHSPFSRDEIALLLRRERLNTTMHFRIILPRVVRKGYLKEVQQDGMLPSYEVAISFCQYMRAVFMASLERMGFDGLTSYVAKMYACEYLNDDDIEELYCWTSAATGHIDDIPDEC